MQRRASDAGRVRVIRNVSRNLQRLDAALRERALIIVKQTVRSGSDDDRGEREVAFRIDQVMDLTDDPAHFVREFLSDIEFGERSVAEGDLALLILIGFLPFVQDVVRGTRDFSGRAVACREELGPSALHIDAAGGKGHIAAVNSFTAVADKEEVAFDIAEFRVLIVVRRQSPEKLQAFGTEVLDFISDNGAVRCFFSGAAACEKADRRVVGVRRRDLAAGEKLAPEVLKDGPDRLALFSSECRGIRLHIGLLNPDVIREHMTLEFLARFGFGHTFRKRFGRGFPGEFINRLPRIDDRGFIAVAAKECRNPAIQVCHLNRIDPVRADEPLQLFLDIDREVTRRGDEKQPVIILPVGEFNKVLRAVHGNHRLTGAGAALNKERSLPRSIDNLLLLGIEVEADLAHLGFGGVVELRVLTLHSGPFSPIHVPGETLIGLSRNFASRGFKIVLVFEITHERQLRLGKPDRNQLFVGDIREKRRGWRRDLFLMLHRAGSLAESEVTAGFCLIVRNEFVFCRPFKRCLRPVGLGDDLKIRDNDAPGGVESKDPEALRHFLGLSFLIGNLFGIGRKAGDKCE